MTDLATITQEVAAETYRPDISETIKTMVKKAIRHAHSLAEFQKDIADTVLLTAGQVPMTIGSVDLPAEFRKQVLVRPMAGGTFISGKELSEIHPEYIVRLNTSGEDINTYYITRGKLHFKSDTPISSIGLMYYVQDSLIDTTETWIMSEYPEDLKTLTKAYLFATLGDRERSNGLMNEWRLAANDLVNRNKTN